MLRLLIICDEVGFAPLDSTGSQLLFRFVAAACELRSLAIANDRPFETWAASCPYTPESACSRKLAFDTPRCDC